jgi:ribosome maturation factor RimP
MSLLTEQDYRNFIGANITVSDNTPPPPAHHTKKRSAWAQNNFTGTLIAVDSYGAAIRRPGSSEYIVLISHVQWHRLASLSVTITTPNADAAPR